MEACVLTINQVFSFSGTRTHVIVFVVHSKNSFKKKGGDLPQIMEWVYSTSYDTGLHKEIEIIYIQLYETHTLHTIIWQSAWCLIDTLEIV